MCSLTGPLPLKKWLLSTWPASLQHHSLCRSHKPYASSLRRPYLKRQRFTRHLAETTDFLSNVSMSKCVQRTSKQNLHMEISFQQARMDGVSFLISGRQKILTCRMRYSRWGVSFAMFTTVLSQARSILWQLRRKNPASRSVILVPWRRCWAETPMFSLGGLGANPGRNALGPGGADDFGSQRNCINSCMTRWISKWRCKEWLCSNNNHHSNGR